MTSRIFSLVLALALTCGALTLPVFADSQKSQASNEQANQQLALDIKKAWIQSYAEEKKLDPATVKWNDLPADWRARYDRVFGNSRAN